jgi:hypothetical protein
MARVFVVACALLLLPACAPSDEEACAHVMTLFESAGGLKAQPEDPDQDHKAPPQGAQARDAALTACLSGARTFRNRHGDAHSRRHRQCLVATKQWKDVLDCEQVP